MHFTRIMQVLSEQFKGSVARILKTPWEEDVARKNTVAEAATFHNIDTKDAGYPVLRLPRVAVDDSVGRPGVVEGRLSQGEEDHDDRGRRKQEHLGDHRDDGGGGVEADRERHVTFVVVILVRGGDDGNGTSNGSRDLRHHDAQAANGLVDDDRGGGDDDDDNGRVIVVSVVHGQPPDLPQSAGLGLESHLHHRDLAEDNLAHPAHRGHGAVVEKISGLGNRRRRRCHDHRAFDGQGNARIARED